VVSGRPVSSPVYRVSLSQGVDWTRAPASSPATHSQRSRHCSNVEPRAAAFARPAGEAEVWGCRIRAGQRFWIAAAARAPDQPTVASIDKPFVGRLRRRDPTATEGAGDSFRPPTVLAPRLSFGDISLAQRRLPPARRPSSQRSDAAVGRRTALLQALLRWSQPGMNRRPPACKSELMSGRLPCLRAGVAITNARVCRSASRMRVAVSMSSRPPARRAAAGSSQPLAGPLTVDRNR
jgi:hypothetical protein